MKSFREKKIFQFRFSIQNARLDLILHQRIQGPAGAALFQAIRKILSHDLPLPSRLTFLIFIAVTVRDGVRFTKSNKQAPDYLGMGLCDFFSQRKQVVDRIGAGATKELFFRLPKILHEIAHLRVGVQRIGFESGCDFPLLDQLDRMFAGAGKRNEAHLDFGRRRALGLFSNVRLRGANDNRSTTRLFQLANGPELSQTIAQALGQNFTKDYNSLLEKIGKAIEERREGKLLITARIDDIRTGALKATGQGLYLPVWGTGTAAIAVQGPL